MSVFGEYCMLLRRDDVAPLLLGLLLNGASTGIPLAIIVAISSGSGFGTAGLAGGAFAVGVAISSPLRGRWVDRRGQTRIFLALGVARFVSLVALAVFIKVEAPASWLVGASALAGLTPPPLTSGLRALWARLVDPDQLKLAYALHAVINELLFVVGPISAGVLIASVPFETALVLLAAIEMLGTAVFVSTAASRSWRGGDREVGRFGAFGARGVRVLAAVNVPLGMAFGALDVAAPALATRQGEAWSAGLAIGALGAGSMLGGLIYGLKNWAAPLNRRLVVLLFLMMVGLLPMAAVRVVPTLILAMAVAGIAVAPAVATVFALIDEVAPKGTATETMTWIISAYAVGTAIGTSVTGRLVEHGMELALGMSAICAGTAALLALAGSSSLRSRDVFGVVGEGLSA